MKKWIMIIAVLCTISQTAFAKGEDGVQFMTGSWKKVLKKAKKENKPIFVDVYADWCGPCKMMDKEVFSLEEMGDFLNENFICYKLDADDTEHEWRLLEFEVESLPTFVFVDSEGNFIKNYKGTTTASRLKNMAQAVL
ncbi:MAG: thioredoxin family protein [Chitinophagales bacterium]